MKDRDLSVKDHSKGREFLTSAQNHQLQQGPDAKCPGYPCWAWFWMESLPSCRKKNLLPGVLQFKGATIPSSGASAPTQGSALGRQGFQEDYLIYPAKNEHWCWSTSTSIFQVAVRRHDS